jgi:hypothetical protein
VVAFPILSGIGADGVDFTTIFPVNLIPVPKVQGISQGYLRPAEGIVGIVDGGGANRGGYLWRGEHYRVMGNSLVKIDKDGALTAIGTIGGFNWATFTASFDHLAINGGGGVYLYDGITLAQITDPDLGVSLDVEWINGYFISTDGEFLVVTDLLDPFAVNPLKYGSSEINPDPVVSLVKLRNEIYAVNRYTIEVFAAVTDPGLGFPFARIEGAQIMRGAVGSRACCEFMQSLAFVGSGDNQPPSVWIGGSGAAEKVATREIDDILRGYSEDTLAKVVLESRADRGHEFLYIHLPDQTLVFDGAGSVAMGQPIWFVLKSGQGGGYRARGMVWCYGQWNVADPFGTMIGRLDETVGSHYGELVTWQFATPIVYNEGRGAQLHELELVALTGNIAVGDDPYISTEYSVNGKSWSQPRYIKAGRNGELNKRLVWDRQGELRNWRVQRFSGDSRAHLSFARLEARMELLAV